MFSTITARTVAAVCALALGLLTGCANAPPAKVTPSGKAEVTIAGVEPDAIRSAVTGYMLDISVPGRDRYTIESDSPMRLVFVRPLEGNENLGASIAIGNSSSSNYRVISFSFVRVDSGVRVIADNKWRAVMPLGKVNETDLNTGPVVDYYQGALEAIQARLEAPRAVK